MMAKSDSIIGCTALYREAESRAARAFTFWTERANHFGDYLKEDRAEPAGETAIETARDAACAAYEALMDAQKYKYDLRLKLARLRDRAMREGKRGGGDRRSRGSEDA